VLEVDNFVGTVVQMSIIEVTISNWNLGSDELSNVTGSCSSELLSVIGKTLESVSEVVLFVHFHDESLFSLFLLVITFSYFVFLVLLFEHSLLVSLVVFMNLLLLFLLLLSRALHTGVVQKPLGKIVNGVSGVLSV
jgi:hypothetical protein